MWAENKGPIQLCHGKFKLFGNFDTWLCCSNNKQDNCHKFVCLFFLEHKFFACEIIYTKGVVSELENDLLATGIPPLAQPQLFSVISKFDTFCFYLIEWVRACLADKW